MNSHLTKEWSQNILDLAANSTRESIFISMKKINELHDQIHLNILAEVDKQMSEKFNPPDFKFCLVEMGSGGRRERPLWTDQDNAIIYSCDTKNMAKVRAYLQEWADEAVYSLSIVGYPLCDGWVMPTNPRWLQSLEGWQQNWTEWSRTLTTENMRFLLLSMDLRAIYGDQSLVEQLKGWLLKIEDSSSLWTREILLYALKYPLPVGVLGNLITPLYGQYAGLFHLKEGGYYQMVAMIRALALYVGIEQTSTRDRIEELYRKGYLSGEEQQKWLDCLGFYLHFRLKHHLQCFQQNTPIQDYINLTDWRSEDVEGLKHCLQFIRKQQRRWHKKISSRKWEGLP